MEPHKVSFINHEMSGQEAEFDGVFIEDAIAGRWHNVEDPDIKGRLCLYRISDHQRDTPGTLRC
jgi:hypothetical protein